MPTLTLESDTGRKGKYTERHGGSARRAVSSDGGVAGAFRGCVAGARGRGLGTLNSVGAGLVGLIVLERLDLEVGEERSIRVLHLQGNLVRSDVHNLSRWLGLDTIPDDFSGVGRENGQGKVAVEALGSDQLGVAHRSLGRGSTRRLGSLKRLEIELGILVPECIEIRQKLSGAIFFRDDHQAVVVVFLRIFVDNTAREDGVHLGSVDSANLGEDTGIRIVAAIFRVKDGHRAVLEAVDQVAVGRLLEITLSAPAVAVQGKEIGVAHVVLIAVFNALEVVVAIPQDGSDIGGRVTDGNGTIGVLGDVVLEISGDGADVGGDDLGRIDVVNDLVSREESQRVGVVLEGLDDGKGAVEIRGIVRLPSVEVLERLAG